MTRRPFGTLPDGSPVEALTLTGGGPLGWRRLPAQKNQYQTYTKYLTCITAHL